MHMMMYNTSFPQLVFQTYGFGFPAKNVRGRS
jgi:hypothetical protein